MGTHVVNTCWPKLVKSWKMHKSTFLETCFFHDFTNLVNTCWLHDGLHFNFQKSFKIAVSRGFSAITKWSLEVRLLEIWTYDLGGVENYQNGIPNSKGLSKYEIAPVQVIHEKNHIWTQIFIILTKNPNLKISIMHVLSIMILKVDYFNCFSSSRKI